MTRRKRRGRRTVPASVILDQGQTGRMESLLSGLDASLRALDNATELMVEMVRLSRECLSATSKMHQAAADLLDSLHDERDRRTTGRVNHAPAKAKKDDPYSYPICMECELSHVPGSKVCVQCGAALIDGGVAFVPVRTPDATTSHPTNEDLGGM